MKNLKKNKKGFTLIEMIVVIVIVAILAAISVPAVLKYIDEARNTKLIAKADGAKVAYEAELAKQMAKGDGVITATYMTAAETSAKADSGDEVTAIVLCSNESGPQESEDTPTCTAPTDAAKLKMTGITGYKITISGTNVYIPLNDSAFVK